MKNQINIILLSLLIVATTMQAQTPLTAARNSFRDGDRIVKQEIEYMSPGRVGSNVLWDMSEAAVVNEAYRVSYWDVPDSEGVTAGTEHLTSYYYRQQGDTLLLTDSILPMTAAGVVARLTDGRPLMEEHSYRWYAPGYRYPVLETVAIGMRGGAPQYTTAYYYAPSEQEELVADTDNELLRGEGAGGLRQGRKGAPSKKGGTGGIVDDLHFSYNISTPGADGKVRVEFFNSQTADIAWYDYGARWYDATAPTCHTMDPLCEKYYSISPYAYCLDNPVNAVDYDGKKVYLFSTYLPNNDWLSIATHTFIVVQDSRGKITYAAYGPKHNDPISGNDMLALCEYEPDKKAYTDYLYKHIQNSRIKGVELIPVPQSMTSDEFDARVIDVIHNFGNNPRIKYKLNPTDKDEGNCNSSSSTILLKAGVSGEDVERIGKN